MKLEIIDYLPERNLTEPNARMICRIYEIDDKVERIIYDKHRSSWIDMAVWGFDKNNKSYQGILIEIIDPLILMT